MLPATVLAAILMNGSLEIYSIPAAVMASGLATICFLFITKFQIPLYYGSSFSYIPAVGIVTGYAVSNGESPASTLGAILIASVISGLMSIGAGLLIKRFGKEAIDKILPPHITGTIAMIIGLSLARVTLQSLTGDFTASGDFAAIDWLGVLIGVIALLATTIFTVLLKKLYSKFQFYLVWLGVVFSYALWIPFQPGGYAGYFGAIANAQALKSLRCIDAMGNHSKCI